MIFQRVINLWKISALDIDEIMHKPKNKKEFVRDILKLKKQRLATVVQDEPLKVFEEEEKENDQTNK